ncbi:MAG: 1-deoxy-D-xylulose-5-phosphate synthase [Bacilli bacterium]|nr:1-deoxy-D-xylulose-5-phosphate synthase [Bacilli bacterium]
MLLEKVNNTEDLKKLKIKEKKQLAQEIREYIIDVVSKNGGHLASNLGVVELTLALESVFDVEKDKIVWDVGHQCYTHKILNGRKEKLKTLRQLNGISGFPKTNESNTDCFNTGHSSTSISAAMGLAKARDLNNDNYSVVAVIGDGALTGGMALEALNHVGYTKTKLIIILNDNEMSISQNSSGMNKLLTKLRSKKKYRKSNEYGKRVINSIPLIGKETVKIVGKGKKAIKQLILPGMYFEEIGINYLGPVDGHNISDLESILKRAKNFEEPVLIHVKTIKGKGYAPAENNPTKFHGIGKFDKATGETLSKSSTNYSKVFGNKLVEMAKDNVRIVGITAAMKDGVGLTEFAKQYPDRFFDVGIAEQHAITFAAGLAQNGMIPFVSIYSSFYQRAYDQVIHDVCTQNLPVIMCVDRAGIVGNDGETHQGVYDIAFFKNVPNLTIMAPKNYKELEQMMEYAVKLESPVVIRYPRGEESKTIIRQNKKISLGKVEIIREGTDISIIAIGNKVANAIEISDRLKKKNISCEIINVRFIKPLDTKEIIKSINKTKNVITIEDGTIIGGLGSTIKETIVDNELNDIKIKCFAYPDKFITHGTNKELESKYKVDNETIIKTIVKMKKS